MVSNENSRHRTEQEEALIVETSIHYDDFVNAEADDVRHVLEVFRERADELASEAFAGLKEPCVGEDCDAECLVPEEWASLSRGIDSDHVMDFLGIKRAEPLRRVADWE